MTSYEESNIISRPASINMSPNSMSKRTKLPPVPKFDTNAFGPPAMGFDDRPSFNNPQTSEFIAAAPSFNLNKPPASENIFKEEPKAFPEPKVMAPPGTSKDENAGSVKHAGPKKVPAFVPDINMQLINKLYADKDLANKDKKEVKKPAAPTTGDTVSHQFMKSRDEYDPARPNDYEAVLEERRKKQMEEEEQRQKALEKMEEEEFISLGGEPNLSKYPTMEDEQQEQEEDEPSTEEKVLKMLEKQGWKMGEGLGKNRQGMTTPLIAKKTAANTAVIVNSSVDMTAVLPPEVVAKKAREAQYNMPPTKVLVFLNMVSPTDTIDEQLRDEVIEECSHFGRVLSCEVYEMTHVPEDQAIRIFVEFDRKESAVNAFGSIHGRFFGGRTVTAKFYDEEAYGVRELHLPF